MVAQNTEPGWSLSATSLSHYQMPACDESRVSLEEDSIARQIAFRYAATDWDRRSLATRPSTHEPSAHSEFEHDSYHDEPVLPPRKRKRGPSSPTESEGALHPIAKLHDSSRVGSEEAEMPEKLRKKSRLAQTRLRGRQSKFNAIHDERSRLWVESEDFLQECAERLKEHGEEELGDGLADYLVRRQQTLHNETIEALSGRQTHSKAKEADDEEDPNNYLWKRQ